MSFYVIYSEKNLTKLDVVERHSQEDLEKEGLKRASRKTWGFRRNANFYARHLSSTFNLSTLGGKLFPLD
jgi:hypothetical protein